MRLFFILSIVLVSLASWGRIKVSNGREDAQATKIRSRFESALDLHRERKMGIGFMAAGATGVAGINMQMNFALDTGFEIGYGTGRDFNAFHFSIKQLLGTGFFAPYYGLGYARWSGRGQPIGSRSNPGILSEKFLSGEERQSGEFAENLIYPSLGFQVYKMSGDWAGSSIFAELVYLVDLDDFSGGPTGGLGYTYFF